MKSYDKLTPDVVYRLEEQTAQNKHKLRELIEKFNAGQILDTQMWLSKMLKMAEETTRKCEEKSPTYDAFWISKLSLQLAIVLFEELALPVLQQRLKEKKESESHG